MALLRAVNVGRTGRLEMRRLRAICDEAGCAEARTIGASGNVVFRSALGEDAIRAALERGLRAEIGAAIGVTVRSAADIAGVLARNPFADRPADRVMALFPDGDVPADPLAGATGRANEDVSRGERVVYLFYPDGMGQSHLRLPIARTGTARNMNTLARIATCAAEFGRDQVE